MGGLIDTYDSVFKFILGLEAGLILMLVLRLFKYIKK